MWYGVGFIITWFAVALWGTIRGNDYRMSEVVTNVMFGIIFGLVWPLTLIGLSFIPLIYLVIKVKNGNSN